MASLEMPEASSSPEVTKEILPEPRGYAGLLLLFLLLTTNQLGGWSLNQQTGHSQSHDKRHVERKPTQQGLWRLRGATDP